MKINNLIILLFSLSLLSCDPHTFNVVIDDKGFEKCFNFECAKIDVSGHIIADRQISTFLKFKLNVPVSINSEKLQVTYNGEKVASKIYLNDVILDGVKNINNDSKIRILMNQIIKEGDTLKVNVDEFILCKEKPIDIGNINMVFVRK